MSAGVRRVLMTADAVGGVWTYALDLAAGLSRRGVAVTLFVTGRAPTADQRADAGRIDGLALVSHPLKLEWEADAGDDLAAADALLANLAAEWRPDIVHINGFAAAARPFAAPVVAVAHSCVPTWWRACRGERAPAEWDAYRARLAAGVAAADVLVAPTAAFLATCLAENGVRAQADRVLPNGRDGGPFAPGPKRPVALAAGRFWDPAKGLDRLLAAAPLLRHEVRVAGDGAGGPGVVALGRLSTQDLAAEMARAAVFVAPARYEPFGLASVEAALSGCALVLSDLPSLRDVWGDAATFVDADDPGALAATIDALLADPAAAAEAGTRARRQAQRYSAGAMTDAYLALYTDLVATRSAAAA